MRGSCADRRIVPHEELFEALHRPDNLPELAPWVHEWAAASALPSDAGARAERLEYPAR